MDLNQRSHQKHLAWHETLELHELVAGQANSLMDLKMHVHEVTDPHLHELYEEAIRSLEQNLKDLLQFYSMTPVDVRSGHKKSGGEDMTGFYAGHLLGLCKNLIRNYAGAITEAATPKLRETFHKHLENAIKLHAKVFHFMEERSFYPAYDLKRLLANDMESAKKALSM